ncbi:MAG TPA: ABC-type transport auxiliary lipoprotein family protein, partial [Xanthomonadales bacterium]|nr:ABC-type transport auxiliary lipoprotein family protein [Xanthomonadales bacterium]
MKGRALLVMALALAGCAVGRDTLALRDVPLDASAVPVGLAPLAAQLQVDVPRAAEPLTDARIALRDGGGAYAVMPGVRWREAAPKLVQSLLVEAFERCACVAAVARTGAAMHADYLLAGELRELAVDDGTRDGAQGVARWSLSLVRARDGVVVASTIL